MITIKMICQDLWPNIVSYVPIDSLRRLSKVSPIFDTIIVQSRPKIFYYGDADNDTNDNHEILNEAHTIILTDYGKKHLLWKKLMLLYVIDNKSTIMNLNMTWEKDISFDQEYVGSRNMLYDIKKDILIATYGQTKIIVNPLCIPKKVQIINIMPITSIDQVCYIDIDSRTYKKDEYITWDSGDCIVSIDKFYGRFKVLYHDGRWLPIDEQ